MSDETQEQTTQAPEQSDGWEWMFIEIMGHRSHWGRTREEERFGTKMLRVDVPRFITHQRSEDGPAERIDPPIVEWATRYYSGSSIFSITLTDEATVMAKNKPCEPRVRLSLEFSPKDFADSSDGDGDDEQHDEDLPL